MTDQPLSSPTLSGPLIEAALQGRTAAQRAANLAALWAGLTGPQKATVGAAIGLTTAEISGTLLAAQEPAHTGDVTNSAGSLALAIASTAGASIEAALQARTAAQRSAHLALMGASFTDTQKIAVQDALLDPYLYGVLTAAYTLPNDTNLNHMFNWSTNGALQLATGFYFFETTFILSAMDATSGNALFDVLGAGTATISNPVMQTNGVDSTTPNAGNNHSGQFRTTVASSAGMVTVGTGTGLGATVRGTFNVTGNGTIIPSIQLANAAAAVVTIGSFFRIRRLGNTGVNTRGTWT